MKILCSIILFVVFNVAVHSQIKGTKTGMSECLLPYWNTGIKMLHDSDKVCYVYADSLIRGAIELGDERAECFGQSLVMRFKMIDGTNEEVAIECDKMRTMARKYGYLPFYYMSYKLQAERYMRLNEMVEAVQVARQMNQDAYKDQVSAVYESHLMLGKIYYSKGVYQTALKEFLSALDAVKYWPKRVPIMAYLNLAKTYYMLNKYDEALEYVDKCVQYCEDSSYEWIEAYNWKCMILFYLRRLDDFRECFWRADELKGAHKMLSESSTNMCIEAIMRYAEGRKDDAFRILDDKSFPDVVRIGVKAKLYEFENRYDLAYIYKDSLINKMAENQDVQLAHDIDNFSTVMKNVDLENQLKALENDRNSLELEKRRLAAEQTRLRLNNANLELEQEKSRLQLRSTQIENYELDMNNKLLVQQKQTLDDEREQTELDNEMLKSRRFYWLWVIIIVSALILVGLVILTSVIRKRAIKQLKKSNEQLDNARRMADEARNRAERSERIKTLFLQNMSHDIRTPLNAICGFSQLVTDEKACKEMGADEMKRLSETISNNTEMLITLVNDIIYVSDIGNTHYKLKIGTYNVNEICRISMRDVMHRKRADVGMLIETAVDDDFCIKTDTLRVQQVLINYLTNAIKHTYKGEICLECYIADASDVLKVKGAKESLVFAVRDTGTGVPEEKSELIFGRFERLDNQTDDTSLENSSTGLGLSICKIMAEQLGGDVRLDKSYKNGARFIFELPIDDIKA